MQFRKTALHIHCVVPPADFQLCNPHTTQLYPNSSNKLNSSSKELEPQTAHYTTKALFFPLHTHTNTHTYLTKHCVYRRRNRDKNYSLMNRGKLVKAIKNKTAPQKPHVTLWSM